LIGPMYLRALVTQETIDDDFIESLVDLILAAATGDFGQRSQVSGVS
jgi:hypothetical protein